MHLYLVLRGRPLGDMRAAVELLEECYGAESRGLAPMNMGLVFATNTEISKEDMLTLGVITFV